MPPQENNIPPVINPIPTPENLVPPKSPRKHTRLVVFISILVVVGILSAGYFWYISRTCCAKPLRKLSYDTKELCENETNKICEYQQCVQPPGQQVCELNFERGWYPVNSFAWAPVGKFADWKTYTNTEYGFEFRYMKNWQLDQDNNKQVLFSGTKEFATVENTNPASLQGRCKVGFYILEKTPTESLIEWRKHYIDESITIMDSKSVIIDGKIGLREKTGELGDVNSIFVEISTSKVLSSSIICGSEVEQKGIIEFNQILSTFKFTK